MQNTFPLSLKSTVGNGFDNRPNDVRQVKETFKTLGLYKTPDYGLSDFIDRDLDNAIRTFQKSKKLKIDGIINPKGETERSLKKEFGEEPDRPEEKKPLPSFGKESAVLAKAGFEYIPDPLGRLNQGHFEDKDGRILDQGQRLKVLKADEQKTSNINLQPLRPQKSTEEKNVELAFAPAVPAGVAAAEFLAANPAALAAIMGAMGIGVALSDEERRKQAKKLLEKLGLKERTGNIEAFPAEKPKTPNHTGHDVEGPVKPQKESFPAKKQDRPTALKGPDTEPRKPKVETFPAKETSPEDFIVLMPDRGDPDTREGNDITMQERVKALKKWGIETGPENHEHFAGGTEGGEGITPLKERKVEKGRGQRKGHFFPDLSIKLNEKEKLYINTGKTRKDGEPIASERRQLERLKGNHDEKSKAFFMKKLRKGMDREIFRENQQKRWVEVLTEILGPPPKL